MVGQAYKIRNFMQVQPLCFHNGFINKTIKIRILMRLINLHKITYLVCFFIILKKIIIFQYGLNAHLALALCQRLHQDTYFDACRGQ